MPCSVAVVPVGPKKPTPEVVAYRFRRLVPPYSLAGCDEKRVHRLAITAVGARTGSKGPSQVLRRMRWDAFVEPLAQDDLEQGLGSSRGRDVVLLEYFDDRNEEFLNNVSAKLPVAPCGLCPYKTVATCFQQLDSFTSEP
ncbi:hypothetical protein CTA1_2318 [Colletotrichum tanaceti]|uniref:Uncharacterized protein n=1 Tax=Colletotrichum tanaceti TaxID=1306861 RepID=A0A4U6X431_9PEZI|nr:hypothetical protein CTA1_2318 [Colletotrichum tanaceti]